MKKLSALGMCLLASSVLLAQNQNDGRPEPPSPAEAAQHRTQFLTRQLNLTAQQQQQATTIFTASATSESQLHQNLRAAQEQLHAAINSNDGAAIEQAAAAIGQLTGTLTAIHAKADAAFQQLLTPDQQTKLAAFQAQHPRGPRGGPDGMPPGAISFMPPPPPDR